MRPRRLEELLLCETTRGLDLFLRKVGVRASAWHCGKVKRKRDDVSGARGPVPGPQSAFGKCSLLLAGAKPGRGSMNHAAEWATSL